MKVVKPTRLVKEAADVLVDVIDETVVIGAVALEVALGDVDGGGHAPTRDVDLVLIAPTRDVDLAVSPDAAEPVIAKLVGAGLAPSDEDGRI